MVTSVPVLGVVAILTDGQKQLLTLEFCGDESLEAWKGCCRLEVQASRRILLILTVQRPSSPAGDSNAW